MWREEVNHGKVKLTHLLHGQLFQALKLLFVTGELSSYSYGGSRPLLLSALPPRLVAFESSLISAFSCADPAISIDLLYLPCPFPQPCLLFGPHWRWFRQIRPLFSLLSWLHFVFHDSLTIPPTFLHQLKLPWRPCTPSFCRQIRFDLLPAAFLELRSSICDFQTSWPWAISTWVTRQLALMLSTRRLSIW